MHKAGNLKDAEALYQLILVSDPKQPDALSLLGTLYLQRGSTQEGVKLIEASLQANPKQPVILRNLCMALMELKRFEDAAEAYAKLVGMEPRSPDVHYGYGNALNATRQYDAALTSYNKALSVKPDYVAALFSQGNVLHKLKRYEEAITNYNKVLALSPGYADAYNNRGIAFMALKKYSEALADIEKTIQLKPELFEAHINLSNVLRALGRFNEALRICDKAIAVNPKHADAHNIRAIILQDLGLMEEALTSFERAIANNPLHAEAYYNRSNILREQKRYDEALAGFEKVLELVPDMPFLRGNILHTRMHICRWEGMDGLVADIASDIEASKPVSTPFSLLATPLSGIQRKKCAEIFVREKYPEHDQKLWNGEIYAHDKIRLGYFSADFHNHATSYLMAELFELHDRSRFEVTAFSFGPNTHDAMRTRLEKAFDRFVDVHSKNSAEIATLAREMEIDIALDLKGFSQNLRTDIFAWRPSPIQVNYLVYPGTMGAIYMDYIIADSTLIPVVDQVHYSEKIIYLPYSYQANDSLRPISDKPLTRKDVGLPDKGIVFCCFNNSYKLTPTVFDIWMRLLHKVKGSVLWLLESNDIMRRNIIAEAMARDIAKDRIIFAPRMDLPEHLARHRLADLFLDTFYINAHTTASDALWVGLPVVTCIGETFSARVAASLLHAIGMPELVTDSHEAYEALALELATQPQILSDLKAKLAKNRLSEPLFNTALYTRHLEDSYIQMWKRYQAGQMPAHIYVQA